MSSPAPELLPEGGFTRIKCELSYDGSYFSGWNLQPDRRTIQSVVEDLLSRLMAIPVNTMVAGRTDAGVHATGQVFHFDIAQLDRDRWNLTSLMQIANRLLPDEVRLNSLDDAPHGFHARYSALRRNYRYRFADGFKVIPPLARADVAPWQQNLDIDLMNEAVMPLIGTHDFAAFCRKREGATSIRSLEKFEWSRDSDGFAQALVSADAFCHAMVRSLVGAASIVGAGHAETGWLAELLGGGDRVGRSLSAPARGLTLIGVDYPIGAGLLERAQVLTRTGVRSLPGE